MGMVRNGSHRPFDPEEQVHKLEQIDESRKKRKKQQEIAAAAVAKNKEKAKGKSE